MQKQEIKSKRRSRELEGPASWREHRAMMSHHDRRVARDRQVNGFGGGRCYLTPCKDPLNLFRAVIAPVWTVVGVNESRLSTSSGPTREAWLRGPSFSHWRMPPRESTTQPHLHHTVILSPLLHTKPYFSFSQYTDRELLCLQTKPAYQKHRRGAGPHLPGQEARPRESKGRTLGYCKQEEGRSKRNCSTTATVNILFPPQLRVKHSVASWLTRPPRGTNFHPTHETAIGQVRAHETQREEGKLQAAVNFPDSLCCLSAYLYIWKHNQLSESSHYVSL